MNVASSQNDKRQSFRFAAADGPRGELVLVDRSRWPISIVDQSAGGFGLLTDGLPPIACGDIVQLRTEFLLCDARIVHMADNERAGGGSKEAPTALQYRLGLIRLRDITVNSDEDELNEKRVRWHLPLFDYAQSPLAIFAVVFGIVVIAALVVGVLSSTDSGQHPRANSHSDPSVSTGGSVQQRDSISDAKGPSSGSATQSRRNTQMDSDPYDLKHLPGALPFVMTRVVRELNLGDVQLEKIRRIIDDTNQAIVKSEESRLLLESARKEAVGVLNEQQRRRWATLSGADTSLTGQDSTARPKSP